MDTVSFFILDKGYLHTAEFGSCASVAALRIAGADRHIGDHAFHNGVCPAVFYTQHFIHALFELAGDRVSIVDARAHGQLQVYVYKIRIAFRKEHHGYFAELQKKNGKDQQTECGYQQPYGPPSFQGPAQQGFVMIHDPGKAAVLECVDPSFK